MKKNLRASILFLTIMTLWGIIYPQYALTEDMYLVTKDGHEMQKDCVADYERIMTAGQGEVTVRFAFLEKFEEWFGENETYEDSGR